MDNCVTQLLSMNLEIFPKELSELTNFKHVHLTGESEDDERVERRAVKAHREGKKLGLKKLFNKREQKDELEELIEYEDIENV